MIGGVTHEVILILLEAEKILPWGGAIFKAILFIVIRILPHE